jgi:PhzF family phenazine biosynthesis protein
MYYDPGYPEPKHRVDSRPLKLQLFQVDAFATAVFSGNPAAVCPLEAWLSDEQMQSIAQENNLSETAFFVPSTQGYDLRWFTPTTEVELCGHATLASAYVIFNRLGTESDRVRFNTKSGLLTVEQHDGLLRMDFPLRRASTLSSPPPDLLAGIDSQPEEVLAYGEAERSGCYVAVLPSEEDVRNVTPNFAVLGNLKGMIVVVTAPGKAVDFVSRCFAPGFGIDEDPVTGSTHCVLAPYWGSRLRKEQLHACQVSARGGEIFCNLRRDRVAIAGNAVCYLEGTIEVQ